MNASDGSAQTNISNNLTANDTSADWQSVSYIQTVADFSFAPTVAKPKLGGVLLWDFVGPSDHTATDNSGISPPLFDSGIKSAGGYFPYKFTAAGSYPIVCTIHTFMTATVRVPMTAVPKTGTQTTVFTITWATVKAATGFNYDIQIQRPGSSDFVDWKMDQSVKSLTFVADGGTGTYNFHARIQQGTGSASDYSAPVSVTVNP